MLVFLFVAYFIADSHHATSYSFCMAFAAGLSVSTTVFGLGFCSEISFPMEPALAIGVKTIATKLLGGLLAALLAKIF